MGNLKEERAYIRLLIGRSCAQKRQLMNLTQQTVAEDTGYSIPTICKFENGHIDNMILYYYYLNL